MEKIINIGKTLGKPQKSKIFKRLWMLHFPYRDVSNNEAKKKKLPLVIIEKKTTEEN